MQYCQVCKQDSEESMMVETLPCNHQITVCLDCIGESVGACPQCAPPVTSKPAVAEKTPVNGKPCEDCSKIFDEKQLLRQDCKDVCLFYCVDCIKKKLDVLLNKTICHICHVNLEDINLIYYKKKLKCEKHTTQICGKCTVLLGGDFRLGCYQCNLDLDRMIQNPKLRTCILCLKLTKGNMSIGPLACDSLKKHKFPICTDCVVSLKTANLICRYCVVKKEKFFTFAQPLRNNIFNRGILSLKISLNEIGQQRLFQDPHNTSRETSFILRPFLFESEYTLNEGVFDYDQTFFPGMSVIAAGTKHLFTGGLNPSSSTSSSNCFITTYELDGRFKNFKMMSCSSLNKRRHGHASHYCPTQRKGWVFGGVCVAVPGKMEFLTSVESFQFDDMDAKLEDSWEAMNWKIEKKLKLRVSRTGAALYSKNNLVYLVGGFSDVGKPEYSIEVVDLRQSKTKLLKSGIPLDLCTEVHLVELSDQSLLAITKDLKTFQIDLENDILLGKDQFKLKGLDSWKKPQKLYSTKIKDKVLFWGGSVYYKETKKNPINGFKYGILDEENLVISFKDVFGGVKDLDLEVFPNHFGEIYHGEVFEFKQSFVN